MSTATHSSYEYRSHFDTVGEPAPVFASPIQSSIAQTFARTMRRVRALPDRAEATILFGKHPFLKDYEKLATSLREKHVYNESGSCASGLLRHLGQLMGWPTSDEEWKKAYENGTKVRQEREKGERARSNKELGQRADREIISIINDRVAPLAGDLHRYTKWFFMYLYQRQWLPLDAQLPIWSTDERTVRTWADIVCYSLVERRLVILELKTGYAFRYDALLTTGGKLLEHTAYNQHQMQLGWMHWRLSALANAPVDAYVVRVNSDEGVPRPCPLEAFARDYFAGPYATLNSLDVLDAKASKPTVVGQAEEIPDLLTLVSKKRRRSVSRSRKPKRAD